MDVLVISLMVPRNVLLSRNQSQTGTSIRFGKTTQVLQNNQADSSPGLP